MPEHCTPRPRETLYFATLPFLPELCSMVVTVPAGQQHAQLVSPYQPQILKCRELIFTEPAILATPLLSEARKLQIILSRDMFQTGKLQARLQKMGLQLQTDRPRMVTTVEFQACLRYTMQAKLAPAWNRVGDLLVQGREFVINSKRMQAVDVELNVTEHELYMAMRAHVIRVPPISLEDLDICRPVLNQFLSERPHSVVDEYSIHNKWCHILPSMKKGKVVKVLHQIPADSPFKTYKDIKRYWKNSYGYRLPETDDGMLYYQIYFRPVGEILFTYPECCMRHKDVFSFARVEQAPILQAFLQDMAAKMPSVCGQKLVLDTKAHYTQPSLVDLHQLSDMDDASHETNLTTAVAPVSYDYRTFHPRQPSNQPAAPKTVQQPAGSQPPRPGFTSTVPPASRSIDDDPDVIPPSQPTIPRFAPTFKPRLFSGKSLGTNTTKSAQAEPRKVPVFKPCPVSGTQIQKSRPGFQFGHLAGSSARATPSVQPREASMAPSSAHVGIPSSSVRAPCFSQRAPAGIGNGPQKPKLPLQRKPGVPGGPTTQRIPRAPDTSCVISSSETASWTPLGRQDHRPMTATPSLWRPSGLSATPMSQRYQQVPSTPQWRPSAPSTPLTMVTPGYASPAGGMVATPGKRKLMTSDDNKPKKPRAKPKVQEGIDVEGLAMQNQLNKVNTATLQNWLREKGLPCRSKDKKSDLIMKVQQALNIYSATT